MTIVATYDVASGPPDKKSSFIQITILESCLGFTCVHHYYFVNILAYPEHHCTALHCNLGSTITVDIIAQLFVNNEVCALQIETIES